MSSSNHEELRLLGATQRNNASIVQQSKESFHRHHSLTSIHFHSFNLNAYFASFTPSTVLASVYLCFHLIWVYNNTARKLFWTRAKEKDNKTWSTDEQHSAGPRFKMSRQFDGTVKEWIAFHCATINNWYMGMRKAEIPKTFNYAFVFKELRDQLKEFPTKVTRVCKME